MRACAPEGAAGTRQVSFDRVCVDAEWTDFWIVFEAFCVGRFTFLVPSLA